MGLAQLEYEMVSLVVDKIFLRFVLTRKFLIIIGGLI
jgi:hypothetical protein